MKKVSVFALVVLGALVFSLFIFPVGCRLIGLNQGDSNQVPGLISAPTPIVGTTNAISFRIILPGHVSGSSKTAGSSSVCGVLIGSGGERLEILANESIGTPTAGIRSETAFEASTASLTPTPTVTPSITPTPMITPTVTFKLILIDSSKPEAPTTTLVKAAPVDASGSAQAVFNGVPALTAIGDIHIEGGRIASWSDFHGACDLRDNVANVIALGPKGARSHEDVLAECILRLIAKGKLPASSDGLASRIGASLESLDLNQDDIYEMAVTRYMVFTSSMAFLETSLKSMLASDVVQSSGGTITVTSATSALNGLEVAVPQGAFSSSVDVKIESADISSYSLSLGQGMQIAAPLIQIDTGGKVASIPISVKIPVSLGVNDFPMAFTFDSRTGRMEVLPVLDIGEGASPTITVAALNFGNTYVNPSKRAEVFSSSTAAGILILRKNISLLDSLSITTGFLPGRDDWQIANVGSILEPRSIGAGLVLGALWYFTEQKIKRQEPALFGLYDNNGTLVSGGIASKTPGLWQDDSLVIRFASILQQTLWPSVGTWIGTSMGKMTDEWTFRACKFALEQTSRPQYIQVSGKNSSNADVSMALIVYKADSSGLYVADPNYPGVEKTITYSGGKFGTYTSVENSADMAFGSTIAFTNVRFLGGEAVIDHARIGTLWQEFTSRTVGRGFFPVMTWTVKGEDGTFQSMPDTFTTPPPPPPP
ncbi:MAG: hypothetical protein WA705_19045, partial [Candidatus Ozemobacteraceae bacterium]